MPTEKFSFRIDLIMVNESVTSDGKISGYMIPNPERYEWKTIDGNKYLYDKFDNLMIPESEFIKAAGNSKRLPIYSDPPEIKNLDEYIEIRLPKMREFLDAKETAYEPANKSDDFLSSLKADTAKFAILSIDLVGSTKLSQKLSTSDYAKIIQLVSRELDYVVSLHGGYVLKHVGDGLIAYFPEPNFIGMNDNSVDCAIAMKVVIENGINQVLKERELPEIASRIGVDSGEAAVRILGAPRISQSIDILGLTINFAAKIQGVAGENGLAIGESTLRNLYFERRKWFEEYKTDRWSYAYPLFRFKSGQQSKDL